MNKFYALIIVISLLITINLSIPTVRGAIVYVDQGGLCPGSYPDVSTALMFISPQDTIYFCSDIVESSNLIDVNIDVVFEGNGYTWFVEDTDVTDEAIRISNNADVLINNLNVRVYDVTAGLLSMGIKVYPGSLLNLSSSNITVFIEQSSLNSYGLFFDGSSQGIIKDSSIFVIGASPSMLATGISIFNTYLTIEDSSVTSIHDGRSINIVGSILGLQFSMIRSYVNAPYGMGVSAVSSTVPTLASLDILVEESVISSGDTAFSALSDQGSSVTVNITNSLIYSEAVGVDVRGGAPFSSLPSFLNLNMYNVEIYVISNEPFQQGLGLYGISGMVGLNARDVSIVMDSPAPQYTVGASFIIGGRFIGGPRGYIVGDLSGINITGPMYGVGVYPYRPFSFGGGGFIYIEGEDLSISNVETGVLIGFDPYTLNLFGVSSIASDAFYVNTSFGNILFSDIDIGFYIGRVMGERAFYNVSIDSVNFDNPANTAGFIINNTSPYSSMSVDIVNSMYSGSPPYTSTPGLISYGEYPFTLMVDHSIIGYMILDGLVNYPVYIIESVYDELNSWVSPILTPNSTWTLGIELIDRFSGRPVKNALLTVYNTTDVIGASTSNGIGFAMVRLSYIYRSTNPMIPQLLLEASKSGITKKVNYTSFEMFYTLPSWYRNITLELPLGIIRAMIYGDLGIGYLNVEGYKGEFRLGSLQSMWLLKYDVTIKNRVFIGDIVVIEGMLLYKGVNIDGYIFVNLRQGTLFIRFGGIEMRGYLL